jgi:hypothetical protein
LSLDGLSYISQFTSNYFLGKCIRREGAVFWLRVGRCVMFKRRAWG